MVKNIDLSVVVTVHREGLLIHKTLRSVFEALKKVEENGYLYEVIIHIDNGDQKTKDYLKKYKNIEYIRVFENNFGDTGPSRNFARQKAAGRYVAFLDGDDLISDNYFIDAVRILESEKEEIIVHPEAVLTFGVGQPNVLTLQRDSSEKDIFILLGENRWGSVLVAKKETLAKTPYRVLRAGYGHEDYVFNIEAIQNGFLHRIAKGTVLFYRRSDKSRLTSGNHQHVIIPAVEAFNFLTIKKEIKNPEIKKRDALKEKGYRIYKKMRENELLNAFITPVAKMTIRILNYKPQKKVPDFVVEEWKKMNHIETQLYPFPHVLDEVKNYDAEIFSVVSRAYCEVAKCISKKPDYVFFVPWVVRGGADKVLFNYIEALKEIHQDWHFAVIATLSVDNTWSSSLPEYVDFIDFGNISLGLNSDMKDKLMSLIVTQLRCKKLHIINSEYGYDWVRRHLELIKDNYDLYISLFAWEYIAGSHRKCLQSYDDPYLFEIFDVVKKIFTDNKNMINYTCEHNGFEKNKFIVQYQPVRELNFRPAKNNVLDHGKLKILWAGRVVPSKLPDIVLKIGSMFENGEVIIDMFGELSDTIEKGSLKNNKNVRYCGKYDDFNSLPIGEYDLFLYTSLNDGMPNVILEATAAGLPVIASNDGGVGEFIKDGKTGILIEDYLNAEAYAKALRKILEDPRRLKQYVKNAQKLLKDQHSWSKFIENVKRDIG